MTQQNRPKIQGKLTRHWEQESANEADLRQAWGGIRLESSTGGTQEGNGTLGTQVSWKQKVMTQEEISTKQNKKSTKKT